MTRACSSSLAIAACCAFSGNAFSEALPPLRVDPALLGRQPAVRAAPPAPLAAEAVQPRPEAAGKGGAGATPRAEPRASAPLGPAPAEQAVMPAAPQVSQPAQRYDGEAVPRLRLSSTLTTTSPDDGEPHPSFITADRLHGVNDVESVADGDAELRRMGLVVNADQLTYRHVDDEVEATGNVRLTQDQTHVTGPKLRLRVDDQVGFFEEPVYTLHREPTALPHAGREQRKEQRQAQWSSGQTTSTIATHSPPSGAKRPAVDAYGQAARIEFQGENQFQLTDATYSTCKPGDDSWFARVASLHLDYDDEVADGRGGAIYFQGVPILYSPWLSFSLNNQRKSGFLPPTIGSTSQSGFEVTLPYYWNIAPSMDATIVPRVYSKRGLQIGAEFRYLTTPYQGQTHLEWLPDDNVRNIDRWGYSIQHNQDFGHGFSGNLNLNGVSDDYYYKDLSSHLTGSANVQLIRQGVLTYSASWWSLSTQAVQYQTLQSDPANPVGRPYELLPQLSLNARRTFFDYADFSLFGQQTSFKHPVETYVEAERSVLYPQLAVPLVMPAFYVTPKFGVHATHYGFDRNSATMPDTYNRTVPISSVDAGLAFERATQLFGRSYTQTLEPRLYYLYVPNRDQTILSNNNINFDTGIADFNFAQIFSENLYTGQDRIADANQLTLAASSRFLDPETGGEYFKAMFGQRLYFKTQSVTLNAADTPRTAKKTDFLAAATGQLAPKTHADAAWQYNPRDNRSERFNIGGSYQPDSGRVLNAAYRFQRNQAAPFDVTIKQVDFSGQWPLFGGWQAVARYNYSIMDKRNIEVIGGLEYNAGCWAARAVMQRFATTSDTSTSAIFVQLELADFSRIGSNPLKLLKRSIPGYGFVDQPAGDPVFGSEQSE